LLRNLRNGCYRMGRLTQTMRAGDAITTSLQAA
jgi:hypothetical protein